MRSPRYTTAWAPCPNMSFTHKNKRESAAVFANPEKGQTKDETGNISTISAAQISSLVCDSAASTEIEEAGGGVSPKMRKFNPPISTRLDCRTQRATHAGTRTPIFRGVSYVDTIGEATHPRNSAGMPAWSVIGE